MLQTGFARTDITPYLGTSLQGYFHPRYAEGVLDPLQAHAVAFDNGEKKAVLIGLDLIGIHQSLMGELRQAIGEAVGLPAEAIFICCTHTHLGPGTADARGNRENEDYREFLRRRLQDLAVMALKDVAPTEMLYTRGEAKDVAFLRRFRMKDGSVRTNPGRQNPDIIAPIGHCDETSSLLILKREGKPEIGIVNFQVHPDVIGGSLISADYPGFVRRTYEKLIPNSYCLYLNGAQGNLNHIDVRLPKGERSGGYSRARYMGEKIALSVIANYCHADKLEGDTIDYIQAPLTVWYNKGRPEQLEEAMRIHQRYLEVGEDKKVFPEGAVKGMGATTLVAEAVRIVALMEKPDTTTLPLTALRVGDFALAGLPGEPFNEIGSAIKEASPFPLTMASCCANGYEGYFPTEDCFAEFSYETATANYRADTATNMIRISLELLNKIK
ncbi:MAG: hypothetical protein IJ404_02710 [Clostridia bacterium]|nr:hypothetical protein [Clostridia bacterium]MBQ8893193.1 hypothetical protein [Clostridia bacterium]